MRTRFNAGAALAPGEGEPPPRVSGEAGRGMESSLGAMVDTHFEDTSPGSIEIGWNRQCSAIVRRPLLALSARHPQRIHFDEQLICDIIGAMRE